MRAFLIGLQFLTRISVVRQDGWTEQDFGASVRYFPLVGAVLGILYACLAALLVLWLPAFGIEPPRHVAAALLAVLPVLATGGIHCDGFMDTMDGLFSGRSRERMLEIMKDSRAGSNAVAGFAAFLLLEYAVLLDMPPEGLPLALFAMPVIGRLTMALAICSFPYARPEGMGKAFAEYRGKGAWAFALATALALLALAAALFPGNAPRQGTAMLLALAAAGTFALSFCRYAARRLGGLTGDVYGAVTTLSELVALAAFLLCS